MLWSMLKQRSHIAWKTYFWALIAQWHALGVFAHLSSAERRRPISWCGALAICQINASGVFGRWYIQARTRRSPNVGLMLSHRRRRWLNIKPTMGQCLVLAWILSHNSLIEKAYNNGSSKCMTAFSLLHKQIHDKYCAPQFKVNVERCRLLIILSTFQHQSRGQVFYFY